MSIPHRRKPCWYSGPYFVSLILVTSIGLAQPGSLDRAAAQTLFDEAMALMAAGRYAEACPKFEESQRIDPGLGTQYNLADCYEKTGRTASAWINFTEVADAALKADRSDREHVARERAVSLQGRLAYVTVVVSRPLDGMVVKRNGALLSASLFGKTIPADPGPLVIEAVAPNKRAYTAEVNVPNVAEPLQVIIPELEDMAPPAVRPSAPKPAAVVTSSQASPSNRTTWAIVAAGIGVVSMGIGATLLASAVKAHNKAETYCNDENVCESERGIAYLHDAKTRANLATIPIAIGLLGLGCGTALWLTDPSRHELRSASQVALPRSGGLILSGEF